MASLRSLNSESLSAPLPTPPSACLLPPFSFPFSQASIPDLAYLALPYPATARLLASSLLPSRGAVILACPPCGILLCALFLSALSPTPLLLHHRYALPPSAAPNLASHPSPHAAYAHTSPSARASGMLQRAHDSSSLFLDALWPFLGGVLTSSVSPRRWEHFIFGVVAPSAAPRSGGSFTFSAVARSASPRTGGFAFGAAAPSTSPRSKGLFAFVAVACSASPRSGGSFAFGTVAPPASWRSGGFFAFVAVARSASPRSRGLAFVAVACSASSRSGRFFAFVSVAPSTTPRSGGSFAFSLFLITAAPRDWGFFNFFLLIVIARLPSIPRRPSARSHGSLVAGHLPGSDLTCRSAPRPPARMPTGVTRSARYAALLGERVGNLLRSLERLPAPENIRTANTFAACTAHGDPCPRPALSFVRSPDSHTMATPSGLVT
ncbi:unnamed protein product [Closterium sp. NIES-64]|nr:unnamed protein product [Closterium sp. NIES-64]